MKKQTVLRFILSGITAGMLFLAAGKLGIDGQETFSFAITACAAEQTEATASDGTGAGLTQEQLTLIQQEYAIENQERTNYGLQAFHYNTSAQYIADRRAREIASDFSHTGFYSGVWMSGTDRPVVCNWTAGENIAFGYGTASSVHQGWMNSAGHRANILNAGYTSVTIGVYRASNGYLYWVQLFGDK